MVTRYSESSTKSSFFTMSARLLVSKLPLEEHTKSLHTASRQAIVTACSPAKDQNHLSIFACFLSICAAKKKIIMETQLQHYSRILPLQILQVSLQIVVSWSSGLQVVVYLSHLLEASTYPNLVHQTCSSRYNSQKHFSKKVTWRGEGLPLRQSQRCFSGIVWLDI